MKILYDALHGAGLVIGGLVLVNVLLWLPATVIVWLKNRGHVNMKEVSDWVQYIIIGVLGGSVIYSVIHGLLRWIKG